MVAYVHIYKNLHKMKPKMYTAKSSYYLPNT